MAAWVLVAGLLLRAAIPLGYMPASSGSGLLFELCPGQLPAGFTMPSSASSHDHHHHSGDEQSPVEADTCQIGHLVSSAVAAGDIDAAEFGGARPDAVAAFRTIPKLAANRLLHRPRGPPA